MKTTAAIATACILASTATATPATRRGLRPSHVLHPQQPLANAGAKADQWKCVANPAEEARTTVCTYYTEHVCGTVIGNSCKSREATVPFKQCCNNDGWQSKSSAVPQCCKAERLPEQTDIVESDIQENANPQQALPPPTTPNKPRAPMRNWNPMCLGIIGGAGPQAGADVFNKMLKTGEQKPYFYQARDMPNMIINSASYLDGITQNNWAWATQDEQVSNIGKALNDIVDLFPKCVREYGAIGLACNTIHDYLYKHLEDHDMFVSIVGAVDAAFRRLAKPGSEIFVLGSYVTMTDKGEYKKLWQDGWQVNKAIPDSERGWLWDNVVLAVQQNRQPEANRNLREFLSKYVKDTSIPISLSCTELPIAAKGPDGKFIEGYTFIDPNEELAKAVMQRGEERIAKVQPQKYAGYMSGVAEYEKQCCETTNADPAGSNCTKCCEAKLC